MAEFLLVHGAWHGAWCWDEVAGALRDRGHVVRSIELPGHDRPGDRTRKWNRVAGYVEAIAAGVAGCDVPPILVGHSMGGYVVQRYLENATVRAAVLVASVPRNGTLVPHLRAIRRHPGPALGALGLLDFYRLIGSVELTRDLFFRPETPDEVVQTTFDRLQGESALAIASMTIRRVRPSRVKSPVSVVAGSRDQIFTVAEQSRLADVYNASIEVLDGGHDLMLDTCWPELVGTLNRVALPGS